MTAMRDVVRTDDFKKEKHVPVIEITGRGSGEQPMEITVSVGKEIPHPNTTAHFINWISLYYRPEGDKYAYNLGRADFTAHGASTQGPDSITAYTEPLALFKVKLKKPGELLAVSYCNIHGLWESSLELT